MATMQLAVLALPTNLLKHGVTSDHYQTNIISSTQGSIVAFKQPYLRTQQFFRVNCLVFPEFSSDHVSAAGYSYGYYIGRRRYIGTACIRLARGHTWTTGALQIYWNLCKLTYLLLLFACNVLASTAAARTGVSRVKSQRRKSPQTEICEAGR